MAERRRRILAVASGGGHWVQLGRVVPAFAGHDVVFATVSAAYQQDVPGQRLHVVRDATRWDRVGILVLFLQLVWILLRERPDVIFTTGALPGAIALALGRWLGCRTIWLDSIANVDEVSLSGRKAGARADLYLTQWPHLAGPDGPEYAGRVF